MAKQLSKYSQEQSTVSPGVRANDSNNPYSFKQWLERNKGVIPGKENEQYQNYIRKWYEDRDIEIPTAETVKENYIQLLKQLTLAFQSEADEIWASDINFDDVGEVQQVIPFYATKLKEIAVYLINKREAIKRAKLKYNQTGTPAALERIFYEYLLKAFTKRRFPGNEYVTNVTDTSVLNTLPELSGINNGFQIFIEELYDNASYFDRDPSQPVSAYFTFNADATAYLDNLNISYEDINWLYTTGVSNLCADNPLLWSIDNVLNQYKNGVPLSAVELYDSDVLNEYNKIKLTEKYLGNDQYILSGGYWIPRESILTLKFNSGNNWFYWLSGENDFDATTNSAADPIPLSASSFIDSGATASDAVTSSDIIFTIRDDKISGAWLKLTDTISLTPTMSTLLDKGKTTFMFPYPGYGLSGEDLPWTGRSYDNIDRTFFYLTEEEQAAVMKEYWKGSTDSFDPLYIYDSNLVDSGATPATRFDQADYIIKRNNIRDNSQDGVFNNTQEYAWLYKMSKTDIPIAQGTNNIHWPLERYDGDIKTTILSDQCEPLALNNIDLSIFVGAVAGSTSQIADHIYKKESPNSATYSEGAWLHGDSLFTPDAITDSQYVSGVYQPGLSMRVLGGSQGSFIWDQRNTPADDIFYNSQHQKDCWYLKEDQFSLFKEKPSQNKNIKYNAWQSCTCRTVLYSPLGHPGDDFDDYNGSADFIAAVTQPTSAFSFKDWRGTDGKDYTESSSFGWFKLDGSYKVEPDIGWGSGKWVTNTGDEFTLSSNVMYTYFRNGIARDNPSTTVPYLIAKHKKTNTNTNNRWYKLRYNKNTGEWHETKEPTDMILKPGDMLSYVHRNSYSIVLSTFHYEFSEREVPIIPDWKNVKAKFDLSIPNVPTQNVTVNVPSISGLADPLVSTDNNTLDPLQEAVVEFAPVTYSVPEQESLSSFEIEGAFTVDPVPTVTTITSTVTTKVMDRYVYTMDSINFVINTSLYGWNYNTNIYDGSSLGSRPIWVEASDGDNDYTKNKQINIWSGSPVLVDEYNFVTQPPFSTMSFEKDSYIQYNKRNLDRITWIQPLTGKRKTNNKKWCKIEINPEGESNLPTYLYNNINELIVSATEAPSNIVLENIKDQKLQINYFARSPFTWSQSISDSSKGIPPTGGVWVPFETEKIITPNAPYTNLSNRHFPTYATVPNITDLYLDKESGGYFIPQILGVSTAVAKDINVILDPTKINNDPDKRGITSIYRDIDIFTEDRGLSQTDQFAPVSLIEDNSTWTKHDIVENRRRGMIRTARSHQDFMPYQTYYESQGYNNNGIYVQGKDSFDPWFGEMDDVWENPTDWPSNFRKQYDIEGFYAQLNYGDYQLYQWKTDIFGNQYGLFKPTEFLDYSIYDRKHLTDGRMLTRSLRNIVYPSSASLTQLYDYENVFDTKILDFDIWYDTMMVYKLSGLHLYRLQFDYENEIIKGISDEYNQISLQNSRFGGTWFFEDEKKVTICTLVSCETPVYEDDPIVHIYPVLRSLDINTSEVTFLYNMTSSETDMSSYDFSEIDHPVFTYDKYKKVYNITYTSKSSGPLSGMYVTSINVKDYGTYYDIYNAKTITPEA